MVSSRAPSGLAKGGSGEAAQGETGSDPGSNPVGACHVTASALPLELGLEQVVGRDPPGVMAFALDKERLGCLLDSRGLQSARRDDSFIIRAPITLRWIWFVPS